MFFRQIFDEKLAQYSYLIGCQRSGEAIVFDPQRDVDRYLDIARSEGLKVVAAAETHIHADFLSGARELAEVHGARLILSGEGGPDWRQEWATADRPARSPDARLDDLRDHQPGHPRDDPPSDRPHGPPSDRRDHRFLMDGDRFSIGDVEFEAVHTPGHTPEHLSYFVTDRGGGASEPMGLLSGDFVFVGDLGRPDLLESAAGEEGAMEPAARRLYRSVGRFLDLPDYLQVWPAHGAGSACGKALGAVPETTVGYERRFSPAILAARAGEDAFVAHILEGQPEPPMYFARMKRDNRDGPRLLGQLPVPDRLSPEVLADWAGKETGATGGRVIIDTRPDRSEFMAAHLPGSIYVPLTKSFCTAAGSVIADPQASIVLVVAEEDEDEAIRALVRIGFDNLRGVVEPDALRRYLAGGGTSARIPEIDLAEASRLSAAGRGTVLDVRYASEHAASRLPGAVNASYTRLPARADRLPNAGPLLVHCVSGARAAVAASYLAREGRDVRYVNDVIADYEGPLESGELT